MRVRYTPRAQGDLDEIFSYLDQHSPSSAARLKQLVNRVIEGLVDFPEIGRKTDFGLRSLLIGRFPYRVFYRVREGEMHIVHVRHTSRRPWRGDKID